MPDKRRHRGKHPEDDRLFRGDQLALLRRAVADYSWLLGGGYAVDSSLKLVGDRYGLTVRQRSAVQRSACTDEAVAGRARTRISSEALRGLAAGRLGIDGYNLLITVESALSDGLILVGRDGCFRDLASLHGTYRHVEETVPALTLITEFLAGLGASTAAQGGGPPVTWFLDRPVSNSGRLKKRILEVWAASAPNLPCEVSLVGSPDAALVKFDGVIATSDSAVLDRCQSWINLAAEIIEARIPQAWKVDFRSPLWSAASRPARAE